MGSAVGPEQSIAVLNQHASESLLPDATGSVVTNRAAFVSDLSGGGSP
jgi:hypothetical protein